jgi:hypothetical protein
MIENAKKEFGDTEKELLRLNKYYESKTNYKKFKILVVYTQGL